jgi:hypothetical protein
VRTSGTWAHTATTEVLPPLGGALSSTALIASIKSAEHRPLGRAARDGGVAPAAHEGLP